MAPAEPEDLISAGSSGWTVVQVQQEQMLGIQGCMKPCRTTCLSSISFLVGSGKSQYLRWACSSPWRLCPNDSSPLLLHWCQHVTGGSGGELGKILHAAGDTMWGWVWLPGLQADLASSGLPHVPNIPGQNSHTLKAAGHRVPDYTKSPL